MKKEKTFNTKDLVLCSLFTVLIIVGAYIRIPLPAVPFTLQSMFAALAGMLLGKKLGAAAVALYLAAGLAGLPVFAYGGGLTYVFQPTFGYVIGYLPAAFITGYVMEKSRLAVTAKAYLASYINVVIVYLFGLPYFYMIANYYLHEPFSLRDLIILALLPTIPGKIITCFICVELYKRLSCVVGVNQAKFSVKRKNYLPEDGVNECD